MELFINTDTYTFQFHCVPIKNQETYIVTQQHQKVVVDSKVYFGGVWYKTTGIKLMIEISISPIVVQSLQNGNHKISPSQKHLTVNYLYCTGYYLVLFPVLKKTEMVIHFTSFPICLPEWIAFTLKEKQMQHIYS